MTKNLQSQAHKHHQKIKKDQNHLMDNRKIPKSRQLKKVPDHPKQMANRERLNVLTCMMQHLATCVPKREVLKVPQNTVAMTNPDSSRILSHIHRHSAIPDLNPAARLPPALHHAILQWQTIADIRPIALTTTALLAMEAPLTIAPVKQAATTISPAALTVLARLPVRPLVRLLHHPRPIIAIAIATGITDPIIDLVLLTLLLPLPRLHLTFPIVLIPALIHHLTDRPLLIVHPGIQLLVATMANPQCHTQIAIVHMTAHIIVQVISHNLLLIHTRALTLTLIHVQHRILVLVLVLNLILIHILIPIPIRHRSIPHQILVITHNTLITVDKASRMAILLIHRELLQWNLVKELLIHIRVLVLVLILTHVRLLLRVLHILPRLLVAPILILALIPIHPTPIQMLLIPMKSSNISPQQMKMHQTTRKNTQKMKVVFRKMMLKKRLEMERLIIRKKRRSNCKEQMEDLK